MSFWYERLQPAALGLAVAAGAVLLLSGWGWRHRTVALALVANAALIFLYLWTLGESVHVAIRVTPFAYEATVGSNTSTLLAPTIAAGRIGLYAGPEGDYRVRTTGEAQTPPQRSFLGVLDQTVRFAAPRSAWANLRLITATGKVIDLSAAARDDLPAGSWDVNRRGELEGKLGAHTLFGVQPAIGDTIEGDLMRPDGTQGILIGVGPSQTGYLFAPRYDQPDALWYSWRYSTEWGSIGGTSIDVSTLNMLQRDLRLLLGSVVAALLLLLLAIPAYFLFAAFNRLAGIVGNELDRLGRALSPRLADVAAGAAGVAAAILTAFFAADQLQQIPHVQDSVAYLFQAKTLALGRLAAPIPRLAAFFTFDNPLAHSHFILMYQGQWFSKYGPGWPILLAIGVKLNLGWLVNPVLTGANLILIYLIGREVYGRPVALIGALLALTSPLLIFLGGDYMAHPATLFYLAGFAWLFVRWSQIASGKSQVASRRSQVARLTTNNEWRLLIPAGFLLAMAFDTRQADAIAFALPLVLLIPVRQWRGQARAAGWLALGAVVPILFLLAYNWDLTGNPLTNPFTLVDSWDRVGFGPGVGFNGDFTLAQGLWNTGYNLESLMTQLFGWPFYLTLALMAVPFLLGRATRFDIAFALSALAIILVYVAYWGDGVLYGPRYYYVALPWLVLLTARGIQELYRWLLRLRGRLRPDPLAAFTVTWLLVALLVACDLAIYVPAQLPIYRGYNFSTPAPLDAVARAGIHHAIVFVAHPNEDWYSFGIPFSANSPLLDNDVLYARDLGPKDAELLRAYPGRAAYVLNGSSPRPFDGARH